MMDRFMRVLVVMLALIGLLVPCRGALAGDGGPPEGGKLPDFSLTVPNKGNERTYLGLGEAGKFKVPETKADLIIVEVFSMYCPYCQKEAPVVNELHKLIVDNPQLRDRVKIIGIGVGNSLFEVNAFRDLYKVQFPLFPDADLSIHKLLGSVRTPYFIVLKKSTDGSHEVIYSRVGKFGAPSDFLDQITQKSGIVKTGGKT